MLKGYIRFVGGPMHNRHLLCSWELEQTWTEEWYDPPSMLNCDPLASHLRREVTVYRLQKFCKGSTVFFEYHVDVDKTQHSGEDFYAPLPSEIEFILLGWFLREAVGPYLKQRYERRSFEELRLDDD